MFDVFYAPHDFTLISHDLDGFYNDDSNDDNGNNNDNDNDDDHDYNLSSSKLIYVSSDNLKIDEKPQENK